MLIHSLGGFEYTIESDTAFVIFRQTINFAVAIFVFMAGYFVNIDRMISEQFKYKDWLIYRGEV